jgi:hypothetical protein
MELYYETVKSGETTLKIGRFRKKNTINSNSGNNSLEIPYSKWKPLIRPRDAAKRYFSKNGDNDNLEILQTINDMISSLERTMSYQQPRGSGISKINNKFRVQGRVGCEVNMYLGMYNSKEDALKVINKARNDFKKGRSERDIREDWIKRNLNKRNSLKLVKNKIYHWECPICSKTLRSKNGHKGHLKLHTLKDNIKKPINARRIIFKKIKF